MCMVHMLKRGGIKYYACFLACVRKSILCAVSISFGVVWVSGVGKRWRHMNLNKCTVKAYLSDIYASDVIDTGALFTNPRTIEKNLHLEIEDMAHKIIDTVEISLMQDTIFIQERELKTFPCEDLYSVSTVTEVKDKLKRNFGELDRPDVTITTLPETEERNLNSKSCSNIYCTLGCICASFEGTYNLKQHCGRVECMFKCTCDFTKYQTGIKTNIKRTYWKSSQKHGNFCSNVSLKQVKTQNLSIVALKLNCDNIEPWCMVHELYKCFCKGRFPDTCTSISNDALVKGPLSKDSINNVDCLEIRGSNFEECERRGSTNLVKISKMSHTSRTMDKTTSTNKITEKLDYSDPEDEIKINRIIVRETGTAVRGNSDILIMNAENGMLARHAVRKLNMQQYSNNDNDDHENKSDSESSDYFGFWNSKSIFSSRTCAYEGRKYSNGYYKNKNHKISTMERNDKRLHERLASLYCNGCEEDTIIEPTSDKKETPLLQLLYDTNKHGEDITPKSKRRCLSNDTNLASWLESSYKMYRQRNDSGLLKNALEHPQHGKVAFHSWGFILQRYQERKNIFLVSRQPPFRIYIAVNTENPFFENCIDINDIRFADLHKFPATVKNLLINATEDKDKFCILRGLALCWEIIGSVTKVKERNEHAEQDDIPEINMESSGIYTLALFSQNNLALKKSLLENIELKDFLSSSEKEFESSTGCSNSTGLSKWFVMAIEDDFSEIRFFRRGFFVKYQSIIKAINVARDAGKTVRLTSRRRIEQPEIPQFGIYAIPIDVEYCVFVGPYEMEDTLGIETIMTILDVTRLKRTRGFWITTNKLDNFKLVENPLSFVTNSQINSLPFEINFNTKDEVNKDQQAKPDMQESLHINQTAESKESSPTEKGEIKFVKPIKIRKSNGFYRIEPDGVLKKIQYQNTTKAMPVVINTSLNIEDNSAKPLKKAVGISNYFNLNQIPDTSQEPFTKTSSPGASQIKISAVVTTQNRDPISKLTNHEGSMFILKPEEINRKLVQNKLTEKTLTARGCYININDGTKNLSLRQSGLENVNIKQRLVPDIEWCSLSSDTTIKCNIWTDVWIECKNIPNLGWIAGIKNLDNLLSFKIPGCEYSEFYSEEEAFAQINAELRKRIHSLNYLECLWTVHDSIDQLQGQEIKLERLYS